jgi:hypothetical protein
MILEGKHAELGTGIFISDIQEGSPAEQVNFMIWFSRKCGVIFFAFSCNIINNNNKRTI